ncbi:MAG: hypothetical protein V2I51_13345 [Anderseniella sp.]|jgi:hypothetical protein|nr:hypothetical protein [Anderseniella sp.]
MRWLIIYLLAVAVIWLFVRNTTWRRGLLATVSAIFAVLMIALTLSEKQAGQDAPPPTAQRLDQVRQSEAMRHGALKPSDIAINSSSLSNTETTVTDTSGRDITRSNPLQWRLVTSISNRSTTYTARDVGLRVMLYACPTFFSTPQADITANDLRSACSRVGQRTVGLEKIALAPGETHNDERIITFPNQLEATNSRYWIEVQTVSAETGQ